MNVLVQNGVFRNDRSIDLDTMRRVIHTLVEDLDEYRTQHTGKLTDPSLKDEHVWDHFQIKSVA